jgi:NAD(P)H-dependent FMN reductase
MFRTRHLIFGPSAPLGSMVATPAGMERRSLSMEADEDIGGTRGDPAVGPPRVAVVIGSTRTNRICPDIARWVLRVAQPGSSLRYQLVDLADVDLPFLDEPRIPARGGYVHEHTRAWSRLVASFDAFVFVFPQYNWGYPAPLKNALDFLYAEWRDKPAGLVTYGTRGGGRAAAQMRMVLQGLHMRTADENVELPIADADVDEVGRLLDPEATLTPFAGAVRALDEQLDSRLEDDQAGTGV